MWTAGLAGLLLAEVAVHDGGALVIGGAGFPGHLFGRDRHVVLHRIGQAAGERAGDNDFVGHVILSMATGLWDASYVPLPVPVLRYLAKVLRRGATTSYRKTAARNWPNLAAHRIRSIIFQRKPAQ